MRHREVVPVLLVLAAAAGLLAQEPGEEEFAVADTQAAAARPPGPTPTFPAGIEQVIVDAVVTDKEGNPIGGLTEDDLIVLEDGTPQTIESFEAVELPAEPAPMAPLPPPVSTNTGSGSQRGRTFVIVFDDIQIRPYRARAAKAAVASFLERGVREGDSVTLVASAGGTWWTSRMNAGREKLIDVVKRLEGRYIPDISSDRMTDWEALRIHLYRDAQVGARVLRRYRTYGVVMTDQYDRGSSLHRTTDDPFVTGRATEVYVQSTIRSRVTLETLERVLNGLVGARGRKSVILISEGFVYDPNLDEFKRVQEASRRANAAVYFVNARGLDDSAVESLGLFGPALPPQDMGVAIAESAEAAAGADSLALGSGGFTVRNTNDLGQGIQKIANETRIYYLLGYIPASTARDGRFREIEVKLRNRKGLKVRARKGYYAPLAEGESALGARPGVDPVLQAAIDSPWATDGIPLRMTAYVGATRMLDKAGTQVVAEVDIRDLQFEEGEGRQLAELEFLLMVAHRESGESFSFNHTINMRLRPSTRERLNRVWFPIVREFELQPGDHQAKLVVRDNRTGTVGSVIHEFDVPPLEGFRVSSPILSDTRQRTREGEPGQALALARREFPRDGQLFCQFEVFGATKGDNGMPRVTQGFEVRRPDGTVHTRMPESEITPSSLGHLFRMLGVPLRDAAPGDYEMRITLRDELSGKTLEVSEPFRVVPPYPASSAGEVASSGPGR
jgi:VWFA-related protein